MRAPEAGAQTNGKAHTMDAQQTPGRLDLLSHGRDALFCYGTLQFDAVLEALLGRIPARAPASAPDYRAAALTGRVYPGLVSAFDGSAAGVLLTDLSYEEWEILDAFEDLRYELREVALSTGKSGWAYVWRGGDVQEDDWDAEGFQARHLVEYAARCARIGPRLAAGLPKGE